MESGVARAYWIARIDLSDPEAYRAYVSDAASAFKRHGTTLLVRGGRFKGADGQAHSRNAVIEFPRIRLRSKIVEGVEP